MTSLASFDAVVLFVSDFDDAIVLDLVVDDPGTTSLPTGFPLAVALQHIQSSWMDTMLVDVIKRWSTDPAPVVADLIERRDGTVRFSLSAGGSQVTLDVLRADHLVLGHRRNP